MRAAALIGPNRDVEVQVAPAASFDQIKDRYRRPAAIPFPFDNAYTPQKALLGRMLFYDPRLSGSGALACASCHNPAFAYGDGLAKAIGDGMRTLARRTPTVVNGAWGEAFMWDGRAASLEQQALGPIAEPTEMNLPLERLIGVLSSVQGYGELFERAFPQRPITAETIAEAIATHERTLVSGIAPFDAWVEGAEAAIPDAAKRGFSLFNTKARCASCHGGWLFTDNGFHDIGLPDQDPGRGRLFPGVVKLQHAFKTPSLREISRRGPYMHNGGLPTLQAVVAYYDTGGTDRPSRSELIVALGLSADEQADIVAFLDTLTSSIEPDSVPALPH